MNQAKTSAMRFRIGISMVLLAIGAFVGGVFTSNYFSSRMLAYGLTSRFIADATVDLAILDSLGPSCSPRARSIVIARLRASMEALNLQSEYKDAHQRDAAKKLTERAAGYLRGRG